MASHSSVCRASLVGPKHSLACSWSEATKTQREDGSTWHRWRCIATAVVLAKRRQMHCLRQIQQKCFKHAISLWWTWNKCTNSSFQKLITCVGFLYATVYKDWFWLTTHFKMINDCKKGLQQPFMEATNANSVNIPTCLHIRIYIKLCWLISLLIQWITSGVTKHCTDLDGLYMILVYF